MKKSIISIITIIMLLILNIFNSVNAIQIASIKQYTYDTEEVNASTEKLINLGTIYYTRPSTVYDFFDENNNFNCVYTSENHVYWAKFDNNMNIIDTIKLDMFYDKSNTHDSIKELVTNFGNAIYYNEHLFVIYGREAKSSSIDGITDVDKAFEVINYPTMAILKYDKQGNVVATLEMPAAQNNYFTDWVDGAYLPFFPNATCSLAINDEGILACLYGKTQFEGHQMSNIFFVDTKDLNWVSNRYTASEENKKKYDLPSSYYNSHSMGTRLISTSDGGYLFADSGDASKRGITIGSIYKKAKEDILSYIAFRTIHYSEGGRGTYGYNNTYSVPGNLIEVSDGYLYIGSLEKTLSRQYGSDINEPWNILVQKYKKDLYTKTTIEDIMSFDNVPVRIPENEPSEYDGTSRLYLKGTEKDYGIKWLTDIKEQKIVINLKAVKVNDNKVVILWEELPYAKKTTTDSIYLETKEGNNYYMIIDKDANIIHPKTQILDVKLTTEEVYPCKDGKIYWTSTNGYDNKITLNVLDIGSDVTEIPVTSIDLSDDSISLKEGQSFTPSLTINPVNTTDRINITWSSSNESIASVDSTTGQITAKRGGTATITCTVEASNSTGTKIYTKDIVVTIKRPKPVTSVRLNIDQIGLKQGETYEPYLSIQPKDTTDKVTITWTSSDRNIATVDEKTGKITATGGGIVTITCTVVAEGDTHTKTYTNDITVYVTGTTQPPKPSEDEFIQIGDKKYKKGDLDKNDYISANDAAVALDIYKNNNATADDIKIGDLDGNNIINAQDAAMILDMYKNGK